MPDVQAFEVVATTDGGVTTIRPRGELDMDGVPAFRDAIVTAFAGARYVVVDLARLTLLDSFGLGVLAAAQQRAAESGARLEIANPRDEARTLLELAGVENVVPIRDVRDEGPPRR